jgi:pSer/pThr/pTyr-binding forkhead associated (FHA) protein
LFKGKGVRPFLFQLKENPNDTNHRIMEKESENALWQDLDWGDVEQAGPSRVAQMEAPPTPSVPHHLSPPLLPPLATAPAADFPGTKESIVDPGVSEATSNTSSAAEVGVFIPQSVGRLTLTDEQGLDVHVEVQNHLSVGRHRSNGLVLKDLHVSGYHSKILPSLEGPFEIVDLNSTGGTFVNGTRVTRQTLANGDRIAFATLQSVFNYVAGALCDDETDLGATLFTPVKSLQRQTLQVSDQPTYGLTLTEAGATHRRIPLTRNLSIGRNNQNLLVLKDSRVSARHAWLLMWEDGRVEILDLHSTWGTQLNGQPVLSAFLQPGDVIQLGPVEVAFDLWKL